MKLEYIDLKQSIIAIEASIKANEIETDLQTIMLVALRKEIAKVDKYPRPAKLPDKKEAPKYVG